MAITEMQPEQGGQGLTATVARRVRGLLAELDMDRQDLGPVLGVSGSSASKRVRGVMPFALDELPLVAGALHTSIEYLLGLTDVRHQGLEPRTRWFAAPERPAGELTAVEQLATVLPFRARLPHVPRRPRPRTAWRAS